MRDGNLLTHIPRKESLCENNKEVSYYKSPEALTKNGEIEGKSLKDIWNDVEDISIF